MNLPTAVLLGLYIGAITGVFPALVAWALAFVFKYVTGVTLPGFGVVVLGVSIAGVQGGLLGLIDQSVVSSPSALVALLVVMMATLYAHDKGDQMGQTFPRRLSIEGIRNRTLSREVIERVGGFGQVHVRVRGDVADLEGYPPLPEPVRAAIQKGVWTFPGDLPLSELEDRLSSRLATEYDLAESVVTIDRRGRAAIAAAPAPGSLSRRVPEGERAVSVDGLVPTGLARGDELSIVLDDQTVEGTVVSARSGTGAQAVQPRSVSPTPNPEVESPDDDESAELPVRAPTTRGGEGRVTVAVARSDASAVLAAESPRILVRSRGSGREFELVSMLARTGTRFRKLALGASSSLAGRSLEAVDVRAVHGVLVLGIKTDGGWSIAPREETVLAPGDELMVVGTRSNLDAFQEVVA